MKPQEINEKALAFLANQDWKTAQELFYENARKFPSHKTYNNLGFFLITEGFSCKNGTQRNALKLGLKYLEKASKFEESSVNCVAMVEAIILELRYCSEEVEEFLNKKAYGLLKKAIQIADFDLLKNKNRLDLLKYNLYKFMYDLDEDLEQILPLVRSLITNFICPESALLYLELLRQKGLKEEGNDFIAQNVEILCESDLLLFYTTTGQYEKGYKMHEGVLQVFFLDEILMSCLVECCVRTNHLEDAQKCWEKFLNQPELFEKNVCKSPLNSRILEANYRERLLSSYKNGSPYLNSCCFFGCSEHKVNW